MMHLHRFDFRMATLSSLLTAKKRHSLIDHHTAHHVTKFNTTVSPIAYRACYMTACLLSSLHQGCRGKKATLRAEKGMIGTEKST